MYQNLEKQTELNSRQNDCSRNGGNVYDTIGDMPIKYQNLSASSSSSPSRPLPPSPPEAATANIYHTVDDEPPSYEYEPNTKPTYDFPKW